MQLSAPTTRITDYPTPWLELEMLPPHLPILLEIPNMTKSTKLSLQPRLKKVRNKIANLFMVSKIDWSNFFCQNDTVRCISKLISRKYAFILQLNLIQCYDFTKSLPLSKEQKSLQMLYSLYSRDQPI